VEIVVTDPTKVKTLSVGSGGRITVGSELEGEDVTVVVKKTEDEREDAGR